MVRDKAVKTKHTIVATVIVLWVLGVLVGAAASDMLPGSPVIPSGVLLVVALLASVGNLLFLSRVVLRRGFEIGQDASGR
jgi:hypothetical protein